MKNFKKLFSILAIVAFLGTTVPTTVLGATYSDELEGAYDYAYSIGITTQPTIDSANMYGNLIRSHMAKMMVNYAKEVLGKTPDTSLTCEFTDIANQSEELQGYIKEACQLGLMGVGISAFNPNGVVTRAQFGTVLSRALYGDTYNGGDPYYVNHLNALKAAGIMNKIDNPNMPEVRGYVMLMMQRAAGAETPAVCETPENVLSCSLGLDTCPAECQAVEAKEGTLTLSSAGVDYTSVPMAGLVNFGSIKLAAAGANITVNSIKIKMQGLANLTATHKVFFEKDGVRITSKASFTDNVATVSFTTPLVVKSSETVDVVMELNETSAGDEIQLVSTDVSSTAQTVNGTFTSPVLRTADYTVMTITGSAVNTTYPSYKVDSTKLVELGDFKLTTNTALNRAVVVKSFTVNNSGNSDLAYLKDLGLYRDEVLVSTKATVGAKTVTFTLNDEIKNTQSSATYVIKGKIANGDRIGDTYNFYIRNTEDVNVIEKDSLFRTAFVKAADVVASVVTLAGGDLRFNEGSISAQTVVPGAKEVVFYEGTLQSMESINLETLKVTLNNNSATTGYDKVLQNLYVKIGNTIIAADAIPTGTGDQEFTFDGAATVNGTVAFSIYGDIKDTSAALKISANVDAINLDDFTTKEYADNGETVASSIGSIGGKVITITQADLALSNNSATTKNVQKGDRNVELAKLEFTTTSDVVSKVYSFKADLSGLNRQTFDGGSVTVYDAAGTALVSETINTGSTETLTFVLPTALTVAKSAPLKLTVKLDRVANAVVAGNKMKLLFNTVNAKNIINNESVGSTVTATSTELTVVAGGIATEVTQSYTKKLVKADSTTVIGSIKVKAFDGAVILKDFNVQLSGTAGNIDASKLSSIVLLEDGVKVGTFTKTAGSSVLYVSGLNKTIDVGVTKTYEVQATFPAVGTSGDLIGAFVTKLNAATFESVYGTGLTPLTGKTISSDVTPVNEILTIAAIDGIAGSNYATYKLTLTAAKQVKLTALNVAFGQNLSTSISGATVTLTSEANAGTTYATGTVPAGLAGTLTLTPSTALDVIGTGIVYVNVQGVTWAANNGDPYVNINLSDISYDDMFDNLSTVSHNNMLTAGYKSAMTTLIDLGKNIKQQ